MRSVFRCTSYMFYLMFLIDFSAAFDSVNHKKILSNICTVGIGGAVLSILTQFLRNRTQPVVVYRCLSKLELTLGQEFR